MTRTIEALVVTVTAEWLPEGKEAYSVSVDAHHKVPEEWVVNMLRQIADGIEAGSSTESSVSGSES